MSSNGAIFPIGNLISMMVMKEGAKPSEPFKAPDFQKTIFEILNTVIGITPKLVLAILFWTDIISPLESGAAVEFDWNWMRPIIVRDLIFAIAFCGSWDWLLYSDKSPWKYQMQPFKMNVNQPPTNQIYHDVLFTVLSTICASVVEIGGLHFLANKYSPEVDYYSLSLMFSDMFSIALLVTLTYWRLTHFYIVHRAMHPWRIKNSIIPDIGTVLYRYVHSHHHKSVNPTAFSGTAMHPIEATIYYSALLIPIMLGAHPLIFVVCKLCLSVDAWLAHDGFGTPSAGVYFHYLHHAHFDYNYGDTVVPLDWLFGTYIENSEAVLKKQ